MSLVVSFAHVLKLWRNRCQPKLSPLATNPRAMTAGLTKSALVFVDGYIDRDEPAKSWLLEFQSNRAKVTAEFVRSMYIRQQTEAYYNSITEAAMKTPTDVAALLLINLSGDWWPVAEKLHCPLLYVVSGGAKEQAARLKTEVPSTVVEVFADAGHALFVDDPSRFNAVLERFVNNLEVR
jgi:pimeloyl-ACP methyl ester carboxylesterase